MVDRISIKKESKSVSRNLCDILTKYVVEEGRHQDGLVEFSAKHAETLEKELTEQE